MKASVSDVDLPDKPPCRSPPLTRARESPTLIPSEFDHRRMTDRFTSSAQRASPWPGPSRDTQAPPSLDRTEIPLSITGRLCDLSCGSFRMHSSGCFQVPVHAVREQPPAGHARFVGQINNSQHLLRCAAEGNSISIGRNNVGLAIHHDSLINIFGTVEFITRIR